MTIDEALEHLAGITGAPVQVYVGPENSARNTVLLWGVLEPPLEMERVGDGLEVPHADMTVEGSLLFPVVTVDPALSPGALSGFLLSRETFNGAELDDEGAIEIRLTTGETITIQPC